MSGLVFAVPIIAIALVVGVYRGHRRQLEQARSLEFVVDPEQLTRSMSGVPPFVLQRDDVVKINEHASGELTLHARDSRRSIRIPAEIERRGELLQELSAWRPLEPAPRVRSQVWPVAATLLVLAAFGVAFTSNNVVVVGIVGSALAVAMLVCSFLLARNRQLDARTRRVAFLVLLPTAAIVVRVVSVLRSGS